MTPPLSISASPVFKRKLVLLPLFSDIGLLLLARVRRSAFGSVQLAVG